MDVLDTIETTNIRGSVESTIGGTVEDLNTNNDNSIDTTTVHTSDDSIDGIGGYKINNISNRSDIDAFLIRFKIEIDWSVADSINSSNISVSVTNESLIMLVNGYGSYFASLFVLETVVVTGRTNKITYTTTVTTPNDNNGATQTSHNPNTGNNGYRSLLGGNDDNDDNDDDSNEAEDSEDDDNNNNNNDDEDDSQDGSNGDGYVTTSQNTDENERINTVGNTEETNTDNSGDDNNNDNNEDNNNDNENKNSVDSDESQTTTNTDDTSVQIDVIVINDGNMNSDDIEDTLQSINVSDIAGIAQDSLNDIDQNAQISIGTLIISELNIDEIDDSNNPDGNDEYNVDDNGDNTDNDHQNGIGSGQNGIIATAVIVTVISLLGSTVIASIIYYLCCLKKRFALIKAKFRKENDLQQAESVTRTVTIPTTASNITDSRIYTVTDTLSNRPIGQSQLVQLSLGSMERSSIGTERSLAISNAYSNSTASGMEIDVGQIGVSKQAVPDFSSLSAEVKVKFGPKPRLQSATSSSMIDEVSVSNQAIEIKLDEINIISKLGKGCFGTVYKAQWQDNIVALKMLKNDLSDESTIIPPDLDNPDHFHFVEYSIPPAVSEEPEDIPKSPKSPRSPKSQQSPNSPKSPTLAKFNRRRRRPRFGASKTSLKSTSKSATCTVTLPSSPWASETANASVIIENAAENVSNLLPFPTPNTPNTPDSPPDMHRPSIVNNNNNNNADCSSPASPASPRLSNMISNGSFGTNGTSGTVNSAISATSTVSTTRAVKELYGEIILASSIPYHPNLVRIIGFVKRPVCLIMDFMNGGSVESYYMKCIKNGMDMTAKQVLIVLSKACNGLKFLHKYNVVHRDIAARNILLDGLNCNINKNKIGEIDSGTQIKLTDFGMTRAIMNDKNSDKSIDNFGALKWMAPESIEKYIYSIKSDVYMVGMTIWEVLHKTEPFGKKTGNINVVVKVRMKQRPNIDKKYLENKEYKGLINIMKQCWQHDPEKRPNSDKLHKMLKNALEKFGDDE